MDLAAENGMFLWHKRLAVKNGQTVQHLCKYITGDRRSFIYFRLILLGGLLVFLFLILSPVRLPVPPLQRFSSIPHFQQLPVDGTADKETVATGSDLLRRLHSFRRHVILHQHVRLLPLRHGLR